MQVGGQNVNVSQLIEENRFMKFKLNKLETNYELIRQQLEVEKNNVRELKEDRTNFVTHRNELEEFFLECMDEVKKDINKRRELQSAKYSTHKSTRSSS